MTPVGLSQRELVVIAMLVNGFTAAQVAFILHLSYGTVHSYRKRVIEKLHDAGYHGSGDKISLLCVLNAEPRPWYLSGRSPLIRSAA